MKKRLLAYVAGPFFNQEEMATIKSIEDLCARLKIDTYSPSRDGITLSLENNTDETRKHIFDENIKWLSRCDLIIAIIDNRDPGTMYEIGMRYGRWLDRYHSLRRENNYDDKRSDCPAIITYTAQEYGVNIMLAESILAHCQGLASLEVYLTKMKEEGIPNVPRGDRVTRYQELEDSDIEEGSGETENP